MNAFHRTFLGVFWGGVVGAAILLLWDGWADPPLPLPFWTGVGGAIIGQLWSWEADRKDDR